MPDNYRFFVAAYAIIAAILGFYALSLFVRARNVKRRDDSAK